MMLIRVASWCDISSPASTSGRTFCIKIGVAQSRRDWVSRHDKVLQESNRCRIALSDDYALAFNDKNVVGSRTWACQVVALCCSYLRWQDYQQNARRPQHLMSHVLS
jgi:hypothetical protein